MTMVISKFNFSHPVDFEEVLEKAEKMAGYPLKVEKRSFENQWEIGFVDVPGKIEVNMEGTKIVWIREMTGNASILNKLLTLALMESGALDTGDKPELKLPLTKADILRENEKFREEFSEKIGRDLKRGALILIALVLCGIGWFLCK